MAADDDYDWSQGLAVDGAADRVRGPRLAEQNRAAVRDANRSVRAMLNAVRSIFPLLSAVERRVPGRDQESAVFELFAAMTEVTRQISEAVAKAVVGGAVGKDAEWVRRAVMPAAAQMVADAWLDAERAPGQIDVGRLKARLDVALQQIRGYEGPEAEAEDHAAVQMALVSAMMPVCREIETNPLGHEPRALAKALADAMLRSAEGAVGHIAPDLASAQSRRMLVQGLLVHSGSLMAECYRREVARFTEAGQTLESSSGWPLDGLQRAFQGRLDMVAACAVTACAPSEQQAVVDVDLEMGG